MDNKTLTLTYLNEDDRAYGLAGMAISLAALNAIDKVAEVSLDSDGPMVSFSHSYYFSGSPSISPKTTWDNLLRNFYLTSAMAISNVMARSVVRLQTPVPSNVMDKVRRAIEDEGAFTCSLEEDEIDALYRKTYSSMQRIFMNPRLHPAIDEFARIISRKRILSGTEIEDELQILQLI